MSSCPGGLARPTAWALALLAAGSASGSLIAQVVTTSTTPPTVVMAELGPLLQQRAGSAGVSRVIVSAVDTASLDAVAALVQSVGGTPGRPLPIIHALAATVPNASFAVLTNSLLVQRLSLDRVTAGAMERTGPTVGASAVRQELGLDGSGIGVAVVDSGIFGSHDDLLDPGTSTPRVSQFVDFVNGATAPYDDYGHGTHVAGIIAGDGFDSSGARSGLAPAASLLVLKVLDGSGQGRISDVIAAFDYIVAHASERNIRVVNVSIATGVYESYDTDPLTVAAKHVVDAGIVVVASAGNAGRDQQGNTQYGGIAAPGNAPWVLTVGASSHMGTIDRSDDMVAAFSSRGPTAVDRRAKPDILAPGVGIESLSVPGSALYNSMSAYLLNGTIATPYPPYLSLSGTSMAAPVVTGSVVLMLQVNPALTPNAVKAILQYTSQIYAYDALTEGTGFLNTRGAVELAHYFAAPLSTPQPATDMWSQQILWGNFLVSGGQLTATANAWTQGLVWGASTTSTGAAVSFGVVCSADCGTANPVWSPWYADSSSTNVVWGGLCGNDDCPPGTPWGVGTPGNSDPQTAVWGSSIENNTVVWGTSDGDTVVWGSGDGDTVVWGSSDGDTVVWGSSCGDPSCKPVIWPRP